MEGLRADCKQCLAPLCLRQQVLSLALGEEEPLCLNCLAADNGGSRETLLERTRDYVLSRECFNKSWSQYESVDFCPDQNGCLPAICFKTTTAAEKRGHD